jgi:hypothetical protein
MLGTCEVLLIISLWDGGSSLISECKPTYQSCVERIREIDAEHPNSSRIGQCVEIGALVDYNRAKAREAE